MLFIFENLGHLIVNQRQRFFQNSTSTNIRLFKYTYLYIQATPKIEFSVSKSRKFFLKLVNYLSFLVYKNMASKQTQNRLQHWKLRRGDYNFNIFKFCDKSSLKMFYIYLEIYLLCCSLWYRNEFTFKNIYY